MDSCQNCFYFCYPLDGEPCRSCISESNWKSESYKEDEDNDNLST